MENINILNNYTYMINAIVFDLDETIGHFTQLYTLWDTLCDVCLSSPKVSLPSQELFNHLLDSFDDYLRPMIMNIFRYLREKKTTMRNICIMIYTNNNGPKNWTLMIRHYIQSKLNYELFDNVICAFKVDGKIVEPCRTTYQKTYADLVRCTTIPKTAKIFFIDDQYHEKMKHDNVYYIKIKPYVFEYSLKQILNNIQSPPITEYIKKHFGVNKTVFIRNFERHYNSKYHIATTEDHTSTKIARNVDMSVGKQILKYLKDFFKDVIEIRQTRKVRSNSKKSKHNNNRSFKNRTKKKYFTRVKYH